jgi:hypothetical protein
VVAGEGAVAQERDVDQAAHRVAEERPDGTRR